MANPTTNFGWVMPTSSSLVTNLPADFNTFGQAVDTSMSELLGGTTGQVLSKTSNTNMDFTWVTPTDQTPLTTKGDLFTFTTVDARLAVGANGTVLTADSAESSGLKWATPAGGGKVLQVISAFNTSTFSTTNTSYTDVTSLSVTITPSSATSKIRLLGIINFGHSADVFTAARFTRDGTAIGVGDTAGSRALVTSGNYLGNAGTTGSLITVPLNYIDSPSSTSAITYKIQILQNGAGTLYVNRNSADIDNTGNMRAISSLIVEEIGA